MDRKYPIECRTLILLILILLVSSCDGDKDELISGPEKPGNTAPTISGNPSSVAAVGANYSFTPAANDNDGDSLSFTVENAPGWLALDTQTGTLSGVPLSEQEGYYSNISLLSFDGHLYSSPLRFAITVGDDVNTPPAIQGRPSTIVGVGDIYSFTPTASDDTAVVSFDVANLPSWAAFDSSNGRVSGQPSETDVGGYPNISIRAYDGSLYSQPLAFGIQVFSAQSPEFTSATVYLNDSILQGLRTKLAVGDSAAVRFKNMVDGQMGGDNVYAFEQWFAALMYQITEQDAYCNYAVAHVNEYLASEEALIESGGRPVVARDSYLYVGEHIAEVALVRDWCSGFLNEATVARWRVFADQSVYNVWNHNEANWGGNLHTWSGWSVDNPYNNYYYSFLQATMLTALAFENDGLVLGDWRRMFRTTKIEEQLLPIFNTELIGGGSREGTGYGTSLRTLYILFDWWYQSTGESLVSLTNHVRDNSYYMLHALVPTRDYLVPFGDHARDAVAKFFDYHRTLMLESAFMHPFEPVSGVVKYQLARSSVPEQGFRFTYIFDYLYSLNDIQEQPPSILSDSYFAPGAGHLFSRTDWTESAVHFSTNIGPYTESHDHRDKGGFLLFKNDWLAYDQNVNSQSGINEFEWAHNIVRIQDQNTLEDYITLWDAPEPEIFGIQNHAEWLWVAVDTKPLFDRERVVQPLSENRREMVFIKDGVLVVFDNVVDLEGFDTRKIWQLNSPYQPVRVGENYQITGGVSTLRVLSILPENRQVNIVNYAEVEGMRAGYTDSAGTPTTGYRLELSSTVATEQFLQVLDVDNQVLSYNYTENANDYQLDINMVSGERYSIHFSKQSMGGSLQQGTQPVVQLNEGIQMD